MYTRGRERKFKHLAAEETQLGTETAVFQEYLLPIYMVSYFKYLGGMIIVADDDWVEVISNMRKVQKRWKKISLILGWEGENT